MPNPTKAKSLSQFKVLYAEGDQKVLSEQMLVVQKAGHTVETAVGRKAAEEAFKRTAFDFVLLGATLSKNDRHHLPYMAKKAHGTTKVLVMHTDGERHPAVDANIDTGRSIEEMLAKIPALAQDVAPLAGMAKAAGAGR